MTELAERSYTTVDKSDWGPGPWQDEPDKVQWVDEATDLDCLIHRGPMSALCGYVGVPNGHPLYGKEYGEVPVDVHGGLTYSDVCQENDQDVSRGVCHVPYPGRTEDVWWLGFDCGHGFDYIPGTVARMREYNLDSGMPPDIGATYKDIEYVKQQTTSLARQIKEIADATNR